MNSLIKVAKIMKKKNKSDRETHETEVNDFEIKNGDREKNNRHAVVRKVVEEKEQDVASDIIKRLREPLTQLNEALSDIASDVFKAAGVPSIMPEADMFESGGLIVIEAVIPGAEVEDIRVRFKNNVVFIRGEIFASEDLEEEEMYLSERYYGQFKRTVTLPVTVDPTDADAFYRGGILRIELPISEKGKDNFPEVELAIESD